MRFAGFFRTYLFPLALPAIPATAKKTKVRKTKSSAAGLAQLKKMAARYAPPPCGLNIQALRGDRKALVKLIEAARFLDDIFLIQYWSGNHTLYAGCRRTPPLGKARLHYFWINKGPWSALDDNKRLSSRRSRAKPRARTSTPRT